MLQAESPRHTATKELAQTNQVAVLPTAKGRYAAENGWVGCSGATAGLLHEGMDETCSP